jgi:hypothetical protein
MIFEIAKPVPEQMAINRHNSFLSLFFSDVIAGMIKSNNEGIMA